MEKKIKMLSYFFLSILIVSCQNEDNVLDEEQNVTHKNIEVKELKYNDLFKTTTFNKAVNKIPKHKTLKTDAFGRTVMEDSYGFTIYDAPVKITETDEEIAYSILIKSDTLVEGNYFENLIINVNKANASTDIIKVKYNLTSDIIPTTDDSFIFSSTNEIKFLVEDNINVSNKEALNGTPCLPYSMLVCSYGGTIHPAGENCGSTFVITIDPCHGLGIGSGGTDSTSGNTTSNSTTTTSTGNNTTSTSSNTSGDNGSTTGSGGLNYGYDYTTTTNNNTTYTGVGETYGTGGTTGIGNPIIVNPVPPCPTCPELEEGETPCNRLKNNTSSVAYKQKFKALTANYNLDHETGFFQVGDNYVDGTSQTTSVAYPSGSKNGTHVHNVNQKTYEGTTITYDATIKILSPHDISDGLIKMQSNNDNPKDTFIVMLSNEGIYVITILEPIDTNDIQLYQKLKKFNIDYYKGAQKIINGLYSESERKKALQKMFLKGLKEMGLEDKIGFFEGTIENENATDINDYKINWTRKKLKNTFLGVSVEPTPCNN